MDKKNAKKDSFEGQRKFRKISNPLETFSSFLRHVFSGTMISRLTGFGREVAMAALFGVNGVVANFWMAFRFAHLLRRCFSEGAMHVSFLPHFVELREKDPEEAAYFFYELTRGMTFLLVLIILCADLFLGGWLWYGGVTETTEQIIIFTMLFSPSLIFITLYGFNSSFLYSENRFFGASAAPAIVNLIWIGAALYSLGGELFSSLQKVAIWVVIGFALQYLVTLPSILRFFLAQGCCPNRERGKKVRRQIRQMVRPFLYAMMGVMATQLNSALDMLFAKAADPHGPAYLWYALRLQQLPLALFGVGLATVVLPALSKPQSDKEGVMQFALSKALVLMLPMTAAFCLMGPSMVQLLFGHGKFTFEAWVGTSAALICYAMALLPMTMVFLLASWFYAKKETRLPAFAALLSVVLNIILNSLFVYIFKWGGKSIALATALSACANLGYLSYAIHKENVTIWSPLRFVMVKTLFCTTIALWGTWQIRSLFFENGFTTDVMEQITTLGVQVLLFSALFLLTAYLCKLREFTELLGSRKSTTQFS